MWDIESALYELRQEFCDQEMLAPYQAVMSPTARRNPVIPQMIRYAGRIKSGEVDVVDCVHFFDAMAREAVFSDEPNWPPNSDEFVALLQRAIPELDRPGIGCRLSSQSEPQQRRSITTYWLVDFGWMITTSTTSIRRMGKKWPT